MTRPSLPERFWAKVDTASPDECWLWTAATYPNGYGAFRVGSLKDGSRRQVLAHRMAYELAVGPIAEGLVIDHTCSVRLCMNPAHLDAVTGVENNRRSSALQHTNAMARTHCKNGHEWTAETSYFPPRGGRTCRVCTLAATHRHRARIRSQR